MAADLSLTESTDVHVQACGDCHLSNFGGFATPERRVIFDINDFDESSHEARKVCSESKALDGDSPLDFGPMSRWGWRWRSGSSKVTSDGFVVWSRKSATNAR